MVPLLCFSCIFFRPCIFFSPVHWRVLHSRFPTLPSQLSFCCTGLKINTDSNAFQVSVHLNMLCPTSTPRLAPLPCELTLDDLFFFVHALYVSTVLLPLTPYKMCFHLQRMFLCLLVLELFHSVTLKQTPLNYKSPISVLFLPVCYIHENIDCE